MRKVFGIIAMLAAVLSLSVFMSGGAEAASNGNHDQEFSCTTPDTPAGAGVTFTSVFSYHVTGLGTSAQNRIYPDQWAFHTTPSALIDRAEIWGGNQTGSQDAFKQFGTGSSNGVSSSWTTTSFNQSYIAFNDGDPGEIFISVMGGVGNGNGECSRTRAVL